MGKLTDKEKLIRFISQIEAMDLPKVKDVKAQEIVAKIEEQLSFSVICYEIMQKL